MTLRPGLLSSVPEGLRMPLLESFQAIVRNFVERRWEPSELNGGKFSEVVYTLLEGYISGTFADRPSKPSNMRDSCRALETKPADPLRAGDRSVRVLIPRALQVLYEVRNNRGVGHVGGDVDPNCLDAATVHALASWIMAELIRIFHDVSSDEAQVIVDGLVQRLHPLIWEYEGGKRVLDPEMNIGEQVLLLSHQSLGWVGQSDLVQWVEYNRPSMFATRILRPLHSRRLIEYDGVGKRIMLTPLGVKYVEDNILSGRSGFV